MADAGPTVTDAGSLDAAGDLPDAAPQMRTGFITMSSDLTASRGQIDVAFLEGGPAFRCPPVVLGDCTFYQCTYRDPQDPLPAPSAGTISVTGAGSYSLVPRGDGTYEGVFQQQSLWTGGETLSVSATGAGIAAFQGTVRAPREVTATGSVPPPAADTWNIPRGTDLMVTWTGATEETVKIIVGSVETQDPVEVECLFPGAAGSGTVPSSLMLLLPTGTGTFTMFSQHVTRLTAGDWSVKLRAFSKAVVQNGEPTYRIVQLE